MYATYHVKADEINADVIQTLKNIFHQREVVIVPKDEYDEMEKARHNAAFTEKLLQGMRDIEAGRGIVKTMAELRAMEHE
jgi:PHD/YefM family antitoxin component YafN of YafNO toxin-antitoxin module